MTREEILHRLDEQDRLLKQIQKQLGLLAMVQAPISPNYRRRLNDYPRFDWSTIGAEVISQDSSGATEVEWYGHRFIRRSGIGKFGKSIWFSRSIGQSENGTQYARLITFKDSAPAEPVAIDLPASLSILAPIPIPANGSSPDSRRAFFDVGGQAVRQGTITPDRFNNLADLGKKQGYQVALTQLQGELN